jgi:hypothetical protein
MAGVVLIALSGDHFRLEWEHSAEHETWREEWRVEGDQLRLTEAAIKGSGAGMEPGPDARLVEGWWVWSPQLPPQDSLILAASGKTGGGWRICDAQQCRELGQLGGDPITLRPCP